jgi:hypothetical protein
LTFTRTTIRTGGGSRPERIEEGTTLWPRGLKLPYGVALAGWLPSVTVTVRFWLP